MTLITKPTRRITRHPLGHQFGGDYRRRLVVTIEPGDEKTGDVITLRPQGRRHPDAKVSVPLTAVYRWALVCRANRTVLERARERKAAKAAARERRRLLRLQRSV